MIAFVLGTSAELIKIAPVYRELRTRGAEPAVWFTGQHVAGLTSTLEDLDLPVPTRWLVPQDTAEGLTRPAQVLPWSAALIRTVRSERVQLRRDLLEDGRPPLVVVHGDTFTAPLGALIGRALRARVAHVEAGLRSGSLWNPFPEEGNRRLAARFVDLHFAPGGSEVENLRTARGVVVSTGANTVVDAARHALGQSRSAPFDVPDRYGVVTLHRYELISRARRYREILELLRAYSATMPLLYLAGAPERERLVRNRLTHLFDDEHFRLLPKLPYSSFLPLLGGARLVVTDSGGLQEECAYLGLPCAIHRERTERHVGIGHNVFLTGAREDALRLFLRTHETFRRPSALDQHQPTRTIVDALQTLGYIPKVDP